MAKLITTPIGSFTQAAVTTINANMDAIEAAIENTLSRDGTTPNQMTADIDLNNNDLLNVNTLDVDSITLDGELLIPADINAGTTAALLAAIKTVDGAGSGLDADLLDGQHAAAFVEFADTSTADMNFVIDEDSMVSNSDTKVPTQQSVKAYVDTNANDIKEVTSRAALKALDTTMYTLAYLRNGARQGVFVFKSGDFSTHIAADPLEGVFLKADAIAATSGAWVREDVVNGLQVGWFDAVPGAAIATNTLGIQRALNLASFLGGIKVLLDAGTYSLDFTSTESYLTIAMPVPDQNKYGLLIPSGVTLEGVGRGSTLRRGTVGAMVVVVMANGNGSQIRNLRIFGDNTTNPISGPTFGSGSALIVESSSITEDKETIIDTIWIDDTPGYGIGCEWGHHNGLTIRNVWIDGSGSDGIDIKRMDSGNFVAKDIVLDNIHVTNFGRTANDAGGQAGIDLRGWFTASNLHVTDVWGAQASAGIRMQGGQAADTVIGSHFSSVTNVFVNRTSGGLASTFGIRIGGDSSSIVNAVSIGCTVNFWFSETGASGILKEPSLVSCRSLNATTYGFQVSATSQGAHLVNCSDEGTPIGFYIEGDDTVLTSPVCDNNATTHIEVVSGALRTQIISSIFRNTGTNRIVNAETTTVVFPLEVLQTTATADFVGTDGTAAQPLFTAAQDTLTVRSGVTYEMEGVYYITRSAGTTSHTTSLLFGGTATVSGITYLCMVSNPNFNVLGAQSAIRIQSLTATAVTAANTSANEAIAIYVKGYVTPNANGTLIPQFQYSAAPGGAPTILARSYFKLTEVTTPRQGLVG